MLQKKYGHLMIIPCTKEKIWDFCPNVGAVRACCAYVGPEFILAYHMAQKIGDRILIFSAKYGFIELTDLIPGAYDITFSRANDDFVDLLELKNQYLRKGLYNYKVVTSLCNKNYTSRISSIFTGDGIHLGTPFANEDKSEKICRILNMMLLKPKNNLAIASYK